MPPPRRHEHKRAFDAAKQLRHGSRHLVRWVGRVAWADYGRDEDSGLAHYFFNGTTGALIDANTNGIPDVADAAHQAPNSSDNYIVALTHYNRQAAPGRGDRQPGYASMKRNWTTRAGLSRSIQNYANGTVAETDTDQDVTVDYQYDPGGRLVTMTAYNAKGSAGGVQLQATKYLYTSAVNGSWQTAAVYPDSDDVLSQNQTTSLDDHHRQRRPRFDPV